MKEVIFMLLLLIFSACDSGNGDIPLLKQQGLVNKSNSKIVQRQLDAYNQRNLDEFLDVYSHDCVITEHGSNDTIMNGKESMKTRYGDMFSKLKKLNCTVPKRITVNNFVIDEEVVTGLSDSGTVHAVAVYEIKNDSIVSVVFIR